METVFNPLSSKTSIQMKKTLLILPFLLMSGCNSRYDTCATAERNIIVRDNRIGVKAYIDTTETVLLFDTGALGKLCLDDDILKIIGIDTKQELRYCYQLDSSDFTYIEGMPSGHNLVFPSIPSYMRNVVTSGNKIFGEYFNGTICPDYKNDRRIWEVNMENGYIRIHENDTLPPNSVAFPMKCRNMQLTVNMPITIIKDGDTVSLDNLIVDYGCFASLWIRRFTDSDNALASFIDSVKHVERYSDIMSDRIALAEQIITPDGLQDINESNDNIFLLSTLETGSMITEISDMLLLGFGFLRHYNAMIDLKNMRLILWDYEYEKPSHISNYDAPIITNLGFTIVQNKVSMIFKDSPAENAGLHPGDSIVRINGQMLSGYTSESIDSLVLFTDYNENICLEIIRNKAERMHISYSTEMNPLRIK